MTDTGDLKDICSCGHYFSSHDGWGCNIIGCGCSWQQVGDDYGALPTPIESSPEVKVVVRFLSGGVEGSFELQCPDCGETYIGDSMIDRHENCKESNHGMG
jgi:hypothetical protein